MDENRPEEVEVTKTESEATQTPETTGQTVGNGDREKRIQEEVLPIIRSLTDSNLDRFVAIYREFAAHRAQNESPSSVPEELGTTDDEMESDSMNSVTVNLGQPCYISRATGIQRVDELLGGEDNGAMAAIFGMAVVLKKRPDLASKVVAYFEDYFKDELREGIRFNRDYDGDDLYVMPWIWLIRDMQAAEQFRQIEQPDVKTAA
jgi:hypothetical protein